MRHKTGQDAVIREKNIEERKSSFLCYNICKVVLFFFIKI